MFQVFTYHLQHPEHGDFLIDTGVARQFLDTPQSQGMPSWLAAQFGFETMSLVTSTEELVANLKRRIARRVSYSSAYRPHQCFASH